jgi:hypothetical protein
VYAGLRSGEEDKTTAFLNSLEYLPVTPEIARQAGLLRRDWQKKGQTLSYTDVTIAAVALSGQVPLLTDNRKHFPICPSCNSSRCPSAPDNCGLFPFFPLHFTPRGVYFRICSIAGLAFYAGSKNGNGKDKSRE